MIKLVATDVDGVLTDCGMYYSESGDEFKKFNTRDGMAFEILRNKGIFTAIITSEETNIVRNRSLKIKPDYLYQGIKNKLEIMIQIIQHLNISITEVAYIGDDINDFLLLQSVGVSACPVDADKKIRNLNGILELKERGGRGVFREFVEYLIEKDILFKQ